LLAILTTTLVSLFRVAHTSHYRTQRVLYTPKISQNNYIQKLWIANNLYLYIIVYTLFDMDYSLENWQINLLRIPWGSLNYSPYGYGLEVIYNGTVKSGTWSPRSRLLACMFLKYWSKYLLVRIFFAPICSIHLISEYAAQFDRQTRYRSIGCAKSRDLTRDFTRFGFCSSLVRT